MTRHIPAILFAAITALTTNVFAADTNATEAYRFEVAGPVQSQGGTSIVPIRLIHLTDSKPVTGAIIIESRADMGPIGMADMTAPINALPVATPGVYPFEVQNGPVWRKPDSWALSFAAKVQGEPATVRGSITVTLKP